MIHRETSTEAYHQIRDNGLLAARRMEVYEVLFHKGPLTAGEVAQEISRSFGIIKGGICARLTELRQLGVAQEKGIRKCRVTNMNVILWDVTGNLPKKPEKIVGPIARLRQEVERLRQENAILLERKSDERTASETIARLRKELFDERLKRANNLADAERVIDWINDHCRLVPALAFTDGPERQIAYAIEERFLHEN